MIHLKLICATIITLLLSSNIIEAKDLSYSVIRKSIKELGHEDQEKNKDAVQNLTKSKSKGLRIINKTIFKEKETVRNHMIDFLADSNQQQSQHILTRMSIIDSSAKIRKKAADNISTPLNINSKKLLLKAAYSKQKALRTRALSAWKAIDYPGAVNQILSLANKRMRTVKAKKHMRESNFNFGATRLNSMKSRKIRTVTNQSGKFGGGQVRTVDTPIDLPTISKIQAQKSSSRVIIPEVHILEELTGQSFGYNMKDWNKWWKKISKNSK